MDPKNGVSILDISFEILCVVLSIPEVMGRMGMLGLCVFGSP